MIMCGDVESKMKLTRHKFVSTIIILPFNFIQLQMNNWFKSNDATGALCYNGNVVIQMKSN